MKRAAVGRKVSLMCFHDELCQVCNALMTAQSLLRNGAQVTLFMTVNDLVDGPGIADPATCYSGVVLPADMNFSF